VSVICHILKKAKQKPSKIGGDIIIVRSSLDIMLIELLENEKEKNL